MKKDIKQYLAEYARYEEVLYSEAKIAFPKIIEKYGDDLYVLGFSHRGSYNTITPMFNTYKDLQDIIEESGSHDEASFYIEKWSESGYPWVEDYIDYFEESFNEACKIESNLDFSDDFSDDFTDSSTPLEWLAFLLSIERVLIRLDKEGMFSKGVNRKDIVLALLAYDESESIQFERIKRLNPKEVTDKVQKDFDILMNNAFM